MGQYYYPQEPKEPSGCMQTLIITRVIFSILAVPLSILGGAMMTLILALYLFTLNPPLALIPAAFGVAGIILLVRWENQRIERERPREED
jgi:hypothetical protein